MPPQNIAMTTFQLQLSRWNAAERRAQAADQVLAGKLDLYCEGLGPVPTAQEIAHVRGLRREAAAALHGLWRAQVHARRDLRVL